MWCRGRVRQHHAQGAVAGRHARYHIRAFQPLQQDDGTLRGGHQRLFRRRQPAVPAHLFQACHHDGEGFGRPALALAQERHRLRVGGVAGQVESPQPLDGQDAAGQQELLCGGQDGLGVRMVGAGGDGPAGGVRQPDMRAADRAGIGLGVKAPVRRVIIFPLAVRAHGEDAHGGVGPVVRDVGDDGEAGAAVGAVDEGIAVAAVGRVEKLPQAVWAGGYIRRDEQVLAGHLFGGANGEIRIALHRGGLYLEGDDVAPAGAAGAEAPARSGPTAPPALPPRYPPRRNG
jgi:hypothetical protein